MIDATQFKPLHSEFDGRVCLQWHICLETVQVHAGYHGLLIIIGRLFIDNAGQGAYLVWHQTNGLRLGRSFTIPKTVVLFLHALHQPVKTDVPVNLVGVWNKQTGDGRCVVPPTATKVIVLISFISFSE